MLLLLGLGASTAAWGAEPIAEAELVRRFLDAPVVATELEAVDAQTQAERTAVSLLEAPAIEARHEAARGEWGATTQAIGASVTMDLGLSALGETRAAQLRGHAGEPGRQAIALESVCAFRADALQLWAANHSASIHQEAQDRLAGLQADLGALAGAGEASGYDRDRTTLAVVAHHTSAVLALAEAQTARARISALVEGPVAELALAEVPEPPSLQGAVAALSDHPALRALTLQRDAAKADRDAARRGQLPDLTVSGGPRWDAAPTGGSASQGFEVGGSVQIPWMDGSRAEARQQTAAHAAAEARLARARAELEAEVRGAHHRVEALAPAPAMPSEPVAVWDAAMDRYAAGESSLDDLLQVATAVEAARLAEVERERLLRRAHLDLACATGRFAEPTIQSVFAEAIR
jgi:cobalt-zinc-cadmium efflux system outer membrane protein